MTAYIFRTNNGVDFIQDADHVTADFYTLVTGRNPTQLADLPHVTPEAQSSMRGLIRDMAFRNGDKIAAIKLVRALSGWGLKESKDWVEDLSVNHRVF
jgi:ribosomal protein L7/L12